MKKEQEIVHPHTQPAATVELAALHVEKSTADHASRVSDAAKVTALQEKDAAVDELDASVHEKDVDLSTVEDRDWAYQYLKARHDAVEAKLTT